jgi:hypothetical protein
MSSKPALGPTQPPIQRVPVAFSPGVKRLRREADHSHLQLVPRPRTLGSIHPLLHTPSWRSALLVKHKGNFIFTLKTEMSQYAAWTGLSYNSEDSEIWLRNNDQQVNQHNSEENLFGVTSSTTNLRWNHPGLNSRLHRENSGLICLSYCIASGCSIERIFPVYVSVTKDCKTWELKDEPKQSKLT